MAELVDDDAELESVDPEPFVVDVLEEVLGREELPEEPLVEDRESVL